MSSRNEIASRLINNLSILLDRPLPEAISHFGQRAKTEQIDWSTHDLLQRFAQFRHFAHPGLQRPLVKLYEEVYVARCGIEIIAPRSRAENFKALDAMLFTETDNVVAFGADCGVHAFFIAY